MHEKSYGYSRTISTSMTAITIFVIVIWLPFFTAPIWGTIKMILDGFIDLWLVAWCIGTLLLFTSMSVNILCIMPFICLTVEYLEATVLHVFRVRVLWKDVVEVRRCPRTNFMAPAEKCPWAIIATKITPLHFILGHSWARVFRPAIIFLPQIRDCDELVGEIQRRGGVNVTKQ